MTRKLTALPNIELLAPEFFSVTYGAGGSDKDRSLKTLKNILSKRHPQSRRLAR